MPFIPVRPTYAPIVVLSFLYHRGPHTTVKKTFSTGTERERERERGGGRREGEIGERFRGKAMERKREGRSREGGRDR